MGCRIDETIKPAGNGNAEVPPRTDQKRPARDSFFSVPGFRRNIYPRTNLQRMYSGVFEVKWQIPNRIFPQELRESEIADIPETANFRVHHIQVQPNDAGSEITAIVEPFGVKAVPAVAVWPGIAILLGLGGSYAVLKEINKFFQTSFLNILVGLGAVITVFTGLNYVWGNK